MISMRMAISKPSHAVCIRFSYICENQIRESKTASDLHMRNEIKNLQLAIEKAFVKALVS